MPTNRPHNTSDNVEAKIDIQQYCKNEALKNKDELKDYFVQENRHKFNKTITISGIILSLLGLLVGIIGTNFIKDYISTKTQESMTQAITKSIDKYVQPKIDSAFALPNIKSLVKTAAKENVDSIARPFILTQLEPYKNKLEKINIYALQASAIAGNKIDYDKLTTIAKFNNALSPDANNAIKAVAIAFNEYNGPLTSYQIIHNGNEIPPDSLIKYPEEYFKYLVDQNTTKDQRKALVAYSLSFSLYENKKVILKHCKRLLNQTSSMDIYASVFVILKNYIGDKAPFMDYSGWIKIIDAELKKP